MKLPSRQLRIGRAADNDVVVSDLSVSRYHAELRRTSRGGYEIVDLDSHNGTYLNGQRITVGAGDRDGPDRHRAGDVPPRRRASCRSSSTPATSR